MITIFFIVADGIFFEDKVTEISQKYFGIKYLYPWQRLVIENILDGNEDDENFCEYRKEKRHQIVLLPTGAGKSLCFMLPAVIFSGATLIIYPLLALMNDQMRRINNTGLEAVIFRGGQSEAERNENFEKIKNGAKFILANPEVLQSKDIIERLKKCRISHITIDEAHCVSEWGDSFRPSYLTLGKIIKELNVPLVTAFTATASSQVLKRISEILFDGSASLVRGETDRENIKYSVLKTNTKDKTLIEQVIKAEKPLIVFCPSRKSTEQTARDLIEYYKLTEGKSDHVRFYHAGMSKEEKEAVEKWFFPKDDAIIVATCAFGMGVDKSNIRTVIHTEAPPTIENFVQEAGRGARDGKDAESILLWSDEDSKKRSSYPAGSRERVLYDYAVSGKCRRKVILEALGDPGAEENACSGCDICRKNVSWTGAETEYTYNFIRKNPNRFTIEKASEILSEKANKKTSLNYGFKLWNQQDYEKVLKVLIENGRIKVRSFLWKNLLKAVKERKTKNKLFRFSFF